MADKLKRYGLFGRPEEKGSVRLARNPEQAVVSAYMAFQQAARKAAGDEARYSDGIADMLYKEAGSLLEGMESLRPDGEKVLNMLREKAASGHSTGIFLSALLNETAMDELVINDFPELETAGYRIRPGKILVLGKKAKAAMAGRYGKGIVLSFGNVREMAFYADAGFQCNFRTTNYLANETRGGVQANCGNVALTMAGDVYDGLQINFGEVHLLSGFPSGGFQANMNIANHMAEGANGGLQANWGHVLNNTATNCSGSIQINYNYCRLYGSPSGSSMRVNAGVVGAMDFHETTLAAVNDRQLRKLGRDCQKKISEIDFLQDFDEPSRELIERVKGFDFGAFEREVLGMAHEIGDYVRREYGK